MGAIQCTTFLSTTFQIMLYIYIYKVQAEPERSQMQPGPAKSVGSPSTSKSHVNVWKYLTNTFKNSCFLSNAYWWSDMNKSVLQLNGIITFLLTYHNILNSIIVYFGPFSLGTWPKYPCRIPFSVWTCVELWFVPVMNICLI